MKDIALLALGIGIGLYIGKLKCANMYRPKPCAAAPS